MNKIFRDGLWVALCILVLSACGGGGGGSQGQKVADSGVSPQVANTTPSSQPPIDSGQSVVMSGEVDKEVQSYMLYGVRDYGGPNFDTYSSIDFQAVVNGYEASGIKILGGKINGYASDISLSPNELSLSSVKKSVEGLRVRQYISNPNCSLGDCVQTVSLVTLADEGYKNAGMGNWKYVEPAQSGGNALLRIGIGSFVFGKPSTASDISSMDAVDYHGLMQGNPEYQSWSDSYFQLTGVVGARYDKSTDTISVSVRNFKYWRGAMAMTVDSLVSDMLGSGNGLDGQVVTCLAQKLSASNLYGCNFHVPGLSGSLKGKFYGKKGEEFAGTFSMRGLVYNGSFNDGAVGAFVAKK
ncbi:hypothetical protein [Chromobacterium vaccinii]|uniref:hypothetical protein n=1 Tax=Chromobacterium vaccinii TaxID=1108595 RepID=UPI00131A441D|nr:hypothetical protein [Chromobacterium vaccinii]